MDPAYFRHDNGGKGGGSNQEDDVNTSAFSNCSQKSDPPPPIHSASACERVCDIFVDHLLSGDAGKGSSVIVAGDTMQFVTSRMKSAAKSRLIDEGAELNADQTEVRTPPLIVHDVDPFNTDGLLSESIHPRGMQDDAAKDHQNADINQVRGL
jgi:hypothetical protein